MLDQVPEPPGAADYVAVIGGGPAGLMAADVLASAGITVEVFESKPSLGRKFLRAGIGGLNLTHGEDAATFCARYGEQQEWLRPMLQRFPPDAVRAWAAGLGIATFQGTSGRVFPVDMKAAPLLRAWVQRLRGLGVRFHLRHRWVGWNDQGSMLTETPVGMQLHSPRAMVLAVGGASWPQLGSDAAWVPWVESRGVAVTALQSANCGFEVAWSALLRNKFAGSQIKPAAIRFTDIHGRTEVRQGEFVIAEYGLEGSLIYALSRRFREAIQATGKATFALDLAPGRSAERVLADVTHPRGARSMSSHLQSRLGITGAKAALLREILSKDECADTAKLAAAIKALPITLTAARPLAEAISTAGGIHADALDDKLMIKALPGVFAAGEMLDWEAPTGGYLLTACLAQGVWAAEGVKAWLQGREIAGSERPVHTEIL